MKNMYLETSAKLINEKVKFECKAEGKDPVIVDYVPPLGNGEGYTSLELLLLSLSTCFATTVKFLINSHLKKDVNEIEINACGTRREKHPTVFESIKLKLNIKSNIKPDELEKVIQIAKDTYCPVWDMLKNAVKIETIYEIV